VVVDLRHGKRGAGEHREDGKTARDEWECPKVHGPTVPVGRARVYAVRRRNPHGSETSVRHGSLISDTDTRDQPSGSPAAAFMLSTPPTIIVPKPGAGIARLAGYGNLMGKGLCEVRFGRPLISEGCERVPRAREIKAGFRSFRRRPDRGP
jgi:hypothetical protein